MWYGIVYWGTGNLLRVSTYSPTKEKYLNLIGAFETESHVSQSWLQTFEIAKDDLEFLSLLPLYLPGTTSVCVSSFTCVLFYH
jgi:hypothetical protein